MAKKKSAKKTPKPEVKIDDDVLVTKEELCSNLGLKIAESTFRKYVRDGTIAKARHLGNRYLLNKTRAIMGMPLADVKEYRDRETSYSEVYRAVWVMFHAACKFAPMMVNFTPYCPEPERYFVEDLEKYEQLAGRIEDLLKMYRHDQALPCMLIGSDLVAEFIVPKGKEPITPRLMGLERGELFGPLPTHHPKDVAKQTKN